MTVRPETVPARNMTSDFKNAFGGHPAGVAIITADSGTGPVGITASSVASVSAEPAIFAFSLAAQTGSAAAIAVADSVMVHLLSADDLHLAKIFASPVTERFTNTMDWTALETGEPLLRHGGYALRAKILTRTQAGNSLLLAAQVLEVIAPASPGAPLVYHQRNYHGLAGHTILPSQ
ncbi:flavin reductase family protein [Arthrobacter glacialis]|uniref:flavin reductase family protein n=1 Tax=Arthrobacter glacialis TaxID=1664 RepID=UPI001FAF8C3A|nr:flavin reductase family protein [Arthrobacter glacialis]